jgi:DNA-binding transcriptional LysR family regulator
MDNRRRPRLSLDLLRGFRSAARHLSFTRAAQELFVTQSAISREVKTLEEQLGQRLFHRVHRAIRLTRAGKELFAVADAALAQLDGVADRLAGSDRSLAVTTTTALASLWLAPRLPRFNRLHPRVSVQIAASNDRIDLERDRLDLAIQFALAGSAAPDGERLFGCSTLPVCAPALARDRTRPLRTPADLVRHVRLDFETVRDGRWWSEWDFWSGATGIALVRPASALRFSQLEQVLPAALEGNGVAMGALPHFSRQLREGLLCAPFGGDAVADRGAFYIVVRPDVAGDEAVRAFVAWLRDEAGPEDDVMPARGRARPPRRTPGATPSKSARSRR